MKKVLLDYTPETGQLFNLTDGTPIYTWVGLPVHEETEAKHAGTPLTIAQITEMKAAGLSVSEIAEMRQQGLI